MKIGLCLSCENAAVLSDAGFDFIEENVQNFLLPQATDEAFAEKRKKTGPLALPILAANCFLPGALKCTGPEVQEEELGRYAETALRRAHEIGIRVIVFGSGAARQIPEGFDRARAREQFLAYARRIAPMAERHEVTVVIEPLNRKECNFINSLAEGAEIVEAVAHPRLRLLADAYHMSVDGEPAEEIVRFGHLIEHFHVAELEGRQAPGTQGEDFGPYLRALKKIGYRDLLSFECGWKQFPEQAAGSLTSFREQVRAAGLD
jgi:sugar phosphate isomerase/epimerase